MLALGFHSGCRVETVFRASAALARASARDTAGYAPNPISRRFPPTVIRSTHFFALVLKTTSRNT